MATDNEHGRVVYLPANYRQQLDMAEEVGRWMALAEQAEKVFGLPRELPDDYLPPKPETTPQPPSPPACN